jgi:hypothetical protein
MIGRFKEVQVIFMENILKSKTLKNRQLNPGGGSKEPWIHDNGY